MEVPCALGCDLPRETGTHRGPVWGAAPMEMAALDSQPASKERVGFTGPGAGAPSLAASPGRTPSPPSGTLEWCSRTQGTRLPVAPRPAGWGKRPRVGRPTSGHVKAPSGWQDPSRW